MSFRVCIGRHAQSREILRMLRYRQKLIKMRTMSKNSLQALALQVRPGQAQSLVYQSRATRVEARPRMSPAMQWQREQWFATARAAQRTSAGNHALAQATEPRRCRASSCCAPIRALGLLTSLCVVHTLRPVSRFRNQRKVAAYAGLRSDGTFLGGAQTLPGY